MVKVAQMNIPPEYEPLLAKVLAWFDNQIYPTWATRFRHTTTSAKKADKAKTNIPGARTVWNAFSPDEKEAWATSIFESYRSGYNLFLADYSYRKKNSLSLPGIPNGYSQMFGFKMSNPAGDEYVEAQREDIVLTGQLTISFNYKKVEIEETLLSPFGLHIDAFYFEGGQNKVESYDWEAPVGNVDWTTVSFSFGTTSRYYFHVVCTFYLYLYNADVFLDNFLITDMLGEVYRECWKFPAGKSWSYQVKSRKQGWLFNPSFVLPYFDVVYLG